MLDVFETGSQKHFTPACCQLVKLLISASRVARITGVIHWQAKSVGLNPGWTTHGSVTWEVSYFLCALVLLIWKNGIVTELLQRLVRIKWRNTQETLEYAWPHEKLVTNVIEGTHSLDPLPSSLFGGSLEDVAENFMHVLLECGRLVRMFLVRH
jgi:hypothetical protein